MGQDLTDLIAWTEHILIVDDDFNLLTLMKRHMDSFGLSADTAENGKEAVTLLEQKEYGVVITDMMMPEMDGMALLAYVSEHHPQTDVLVISGYSAIYSFTEIIKAGAVDFIAKPFEKDELKAKLQRIFNERQLITNLQNEITAHEREFLRRKEEEEKLQAITSAANDAIVVLDNDGSITFWNQAAERIFGYNYQEVLGENFQILMISPRFHEVVSKSLKQTQGQSGAAAGVNLEFVGIRKHGEEFPVELSLASFELKGSSHAVWILRDITTRKKREEDLLKAKAEAEVASRAKTDFMNTISHELLTPMNGIAGFGALLSATDLNAKQKEYLDLVHQSSERLMALISQLLNFANLETSAKDLHPVDFNLQDFFTSILTQFQPKAEEKDLQITCDIGDDIPARLYGDHVVIQQVVSNILENAIKYSDHGVVALHCHLKESTNDDVLLEMAIADSGCGIPREKKAMIFEAFTQVEEYSTRKHQGAGIGLTIAARLVKLMSGEIWLESTENKGSTFYFTVRLRRA